jgi:hypothetical protein
MPTDVRELLKRGAPAPLGEVDVEAVTARGSQLRRRRAATTAAAVAAVTALAVLPVAGLLERPRNVVLEQPSADSSRQVVDAAAFPPDAALAYGRDGDIYVAEEDGVNPVRVADGDRGFGDEDCGDSEVRNTYSASGPGWSPDGRYLAYWNWRPCPVAPNDWGYVVIQDQTGHIVATFPGQGWLISWSPDSTRVAVWDSWGPGTEWKAGSGTQATPGDSTIGIYGLDGVRKTQLTVPAALLPSGDRSPTWSLDGSSILVNDVLVPLDGSPAVKLSPSGGVPSSVGVFSPDGSRVAYFKKGDFVIAEANRPDAHKPTSGEFPEAAWSPSGDQVAYVHQRLGDVDAEGIQEVLDTELRVVDVASGTESPLLNPKGASQLQVIDFSPDGTRILFSQDLYEDRSTLWSVNVDGSDVMRLASGIEWADWRPPAARD